MLPIFGGRSPEEGSIKEKKIDSPYISPRKSTRKDIRVLWRRR
jgi:hypothetical protein